MDLYYAFNMKFFLFDSYTSFTFFFLNVTAKFSRN